MRSYFLWLAGLTLMLGMKWAAGLCLIFAGTFD